MWFTSVLPVWYCCRCWGKQRLCPSCLHRLFKSRTHCTNPPPFSFTSCTNVWLKDTENSLCCCLSPCVYSHLTLFLSPSFQHSSRGVTVHMVLQHCWSPVATLPTMHLWLWALQGADRLRGLWYRPAIAWCEVSFVRQWSVSEQHTPLTSSLLSIPPINPPFSVIHAYIVRSMLPVHVTSIVHV